MSTHTQGTPARRSLFAPMLLLATGIFLGFQGLGFALGGQPESRHALQSLARAMGPLQELSGAQLMLLIFINNVVKAGGVIVLGMAGGIFPFIFLAINGLVVGLAAYQAAVQKGVGFALAGLVPHGVVELPALLVAAALGLELGGEAIRWLRHRPSRVRERLGSALRAYWNWIAPALALAAAIEVFITPAVLRRL